MSDTRVVVLLGSLRADSLNRRIAETLRDQAPAGVDRRDRRGPRRAAVLQRGDRRRRRGAGRRRSALRDAGRRRRPRARRDAGVQRHDARRAQQRHRLALPPVRRQRPARQAVRRPRRDAHAVRRQVVARGRPPLRRHRRRRRSSATSRSPSRPSSGDILADAGVRRPAARRRCDRPRRAPRGVAPPRRDTLGGMSELTPYICVADSRAAIDWYADALGAEVVFEPIVMDDGRVGHCELAVDGARWMMSDEFDSAGVAAPDPGAGRARHAAPDRRRLRRRGRPGHAAGVAMTRGPEDSPPAGRVAVFTDPFGHRWFLNQPLAEGQEPARRRRRNASRPGRPRRRGCTASSGTPVTRGRSSTVAALGEAGLGRPRADHEPGGLDSPRARSASTVSSVWLSVPRPARPPRRRPRPARRRQRRPRSSRVPPSVSSRTSSAAGALDEHRVVGLGQHPRSGRRTPRPAGCVTPRSRAAVSGASGSSRRGELLDGAARSSAWTTSASPGSPAATPVCTGFTTTTDPRRGGAGRPVRRWRPSCRRRCRCR